jgi:hypothetical protein
MTIVKGFGAGCEAALLARSLTRDLGAGRSAALLTAPIARWRRTSDDHSDRAAKSGRSHVGMAWLSATESLRRHKRGPSVPARNGGREMPDAPRVHVSAMEGKGAYNRNAAIPASGGTFAIPLLEKAAQQISLNSDDRPIVIALWVFPGKKLARAHARRNRGPTHARRSATADFRMPHRPPSQ